MILFCQPGHKYISNAVLRLGVIAKCILGRSSSRISSYSLPAFSVVKPISVRPVEATSNIQNVSLPQTNSNDRSLVLNENNGV